MPHNHFDVGVTLTPHMAAAQETIKALDKAYAKRHEQPGHEGACNRFVYTMQRTYAEAFAHERDLGLTDDDAVSASINGIIAVITSITIRQGIKMQQRNGEPILQQILNACYQGVCANLENMSEETVVMTTFDPPETGQS